MCLPYISTMMILALFSWESWSSRILTVSDLRINSSGVPFDPIISLNCIVPFILAKLSCIFGICGNIFPQIPFFGTIAGGGLIDFCFVLA